MFWQDKNIICSDNYLPRNNNADSYLGGDGDYKWTYQTVFEDIGWSRRAQGGGRNADDYGACSQPIFPHLVRAARCEEPWPKEKNPEL